VGRDGDIGEMKIELSVSIHTPAWGVTLYLNTDADAVLVSIHTPAWGVTIYAHLSSVRCDVSIHTPAWGVTQ